MSTEDQATTRKAEKGKLGAAARILAGDGALRTPAERTQIAEGKAAPTTATSRIIATNSTLPTSSSNPTSPAHPCVCPLCGTPCPRAPALLATEAGTVAAPPSEFPKNRMGMSTTTPLRLASQTTTPLLPLVFSEPIRPPQINTQDVQVAVDLEPLKEEEEEASKEIRQG
ncbi:hypothetical protein I305_01915 [Cryptococcus gattii E566]|uniref:Uncharacterized protein n=1 Tax=Cryptococcus gattii EJB2 TaxID=1296103 RepID=A0ABR5BYT8_9TREE|nr:hypothetical protein I306_02263 [Cryptococcus gattii EJB2]KIY35664.1 hypothetical protein I305_01915 [Cryptococcus gattii E566]